MGLDRIPKVIWIVVLATGLTALGLAGCDGGPADGDADADGDVDGDGDSDGDGDADGDGDSDGDGDADGDGDSDGDGDGDTDADMDADGDADADAGSDGGPPDGGSCASHADCGFGFLCDGTCVAVECHLGRYSDSTPDKPCAGGLLCRILDDGLGYNGRCEAFDSSCVYESTCPFGFLCRGGTCVLADCTFGNDFAGYGPRPCTAAGTTCACMEDGAMLNGGRGQCVASPEDCTWS